MRQTKLCFSSGQLNIVDPRKTVRSVLFVCLGNVIRSPFCEGLFRKLTDNQILVDSAAVCTQNLNEPPVSNVQKLAQQCGFNISGHISRLITKTDFQKYDLIVSLEPLVKQKLEQMKPRDAPCHIIELIPNTRVENPWGQSFPRFISMKRQIDVGMKNLLFAYFPTYRDKYSL